MALGRTSHTTGAPRRPKILEARPLVPDDLRVLAQPRPPKDTIKVLRERHHRIAQLVAAGYLDYQVCAATGIAGTTLYRYKHDPAFKELVAQYHGRVMADDLNTIEHARTEYLNATVMGATILADRVRRAAEGIEDMPTNTLHKIVSDGFDRLGLGKHTTQTHQHAGMGSMLEARERLSRITVIDAVTCPTAPSLPGLDTDSISRLRNAQAAPIINRRGF